WGGKREHRATAPAATAGARATHSRASVAAAWRDVPCRGHGPKAVARRSAVRTRDRTLCAVATSATSVRSPYSASRLRATRAARATADRVAGDHHIAAVVEQDGYRAAAGRRACAADRQAIQGERGDTAGGDGGDGGDGGRSTVHHGRIGGDVAEQRGGAVAAV